ncbi:MAG TPA: M24 family metallopeptidase [Chlamydiales bacterium]|nr:M24 family metallopeptidase [Chlamydiales bacterium]
MSLQIIKKAQKHLNEEKADGWLIYDFHGMNDLAHQVLEIPAEHMTTRRFFYWIPKKGKCVKIVHAIEQRVLDKWPGEKRVYNSWQGLEEILKHSLKGVKNVAMEYSPRNQIPYNSKVDGGTIDLIRSFGIEVVSSANFLPYFTAVLSKKQITSHLRAAKSIDQIAEETWKWIFRNLGKQITEYDAQQHILMLMDKKGCITEGAPIVAVGLNSADPHYDCTVKPAGIKKGDFILLDLWCKEKGEKTVYADITRVGVAAEKPTPKQEKIFSIVRGAQKAAVDLIKKRYSQKKPVYGYEADDKARGAIEKAGFGKFFTHRTGHSIEVHLHGSGTHLDNLEMHDVRKLLPGTCFSVEPGIYLPGEFGVRLEHDVLIHLDGKVEITGGQQDKIMAKV